MNIEKDLVKGNLPQEPKKERWEVKDISAAEWATKVVKETEQQYKDRIDYIDEYIKKAEAMKAELEKDRDREIEYLAEQLKIWAKIELTGKKTKTLKLLNGNLSFRELQPEVEITDKEKAIKFCKENGINIKRVIVTSIDNKALKEYWEAKGLDFAEFPGGIFRTREDRFYIK